MAFPINNKTNTYIYYTNYSISIKIPINIAITLNIINLFLNSDNNCIRYLCNFVNFGKVS